MVNKIKMPFALSLICELRELFKKDKEVDAEQRWWVANGMLREGRKAEGGASQTEWRRPQTERMRPQTERRRL